MGPSNCAVVNCYNNKRKLDKWRQSECNLHPGTTKGLCPCPEPFRLFCFPGPKLYKDRRDRWVKLMRRTTVGNAMWIPKPSDRVCSNHFVDKEPTPDHPDPTIQLGYDFVPTQRRRELFRQPVAKKRKNLSLSDDETVPFLVDSSNLTSPSPAIPPQSASSPLFSPTSSEHSYCLPIDKEECSACKDKANVIASMAKKLSSLSLENKVLKRNKLLGKGNFSFFSWRRIKTDAKMNFYTGITTVAGFHSIFSLIEPSLPSIKYWRGPKRATISTKIRKNVSRLPVKKLTYKDELLLTLMRLRLGILNEDLADRDLVFLQQPVPPHLKPGYDFSEFYLVMLWLNGYLGKLLEIICQIYIAKQVITIYDAL